MFRPVPLFVFTLLFFVPTASAQQVENSPERPGAQSGDCLVERAIVLPEI